MNVILLLVISFSYCSGYVHNLSKRKSILGLDFPKRYHVLGTIFVPYAEIEEPFEAWYDGPNKRSRIDLYGGIL